MKHFLISVLLFCIIAIALIHRTEGKRKLSVISHSSAEGSSQFNESNLVYVRADGDNDTIHYLWSSWGSFSILMAQTDLSTNLTLNWDAFVNNDAGSVSFTSDPNYVAVVVLTRLYEYYDPDDHNDIEKSPNITVHNFTDLMWDVVQTSSSSTTEVQAMFTNVVDEQALYNNHSVKINLKAYGFDDHADALPHLLHTANSFQLELVLDKFHTIYDKTRFVLEVGVFSDDTSGEYTMDVFKSIDDEYTPSVFQTVQVVSPLSRDKKWGSFLQWKPICYTSTDRTTESSTNTNQKLGSIEMGDRPEELSRSLVTAYYGTAKPISLSIWVNVSYGLQGDNFYQDNSFLTWTATMGLGAPPSEKFSTLVIAVIIVGFGVPVLLIIAGGIIILVRRLRSKDDDLNLSSAKLFEQEES